MVVGSSLTNIIPSPTPVSDGRSMWVGDGHIFGTFRANLGCSFTYPTTPGSFVTVMIAKLGITGATG